MFAISTDLVSETKSFKIKYFKCFVWNSVEKTAGRDQSSAFFMNCSIILNELMCRFGLASLLKESQQSLCFWGGSGENLAHRAVFNEA